MPAPYRSSLFWFRRDLRDEDNAGLHAALTSSERVHCAFVFDREILDALPSRHDRRVDFIHRSVAELAKALQGRGGDLVVLHDTARDAIPALARRLQVDAVFANGDYEPQALARDAAVDRALQADGRRFHRAKDQALFEKDEVLTKAGRPFTVFTPYARTWRTMLEPFYVQAYPVARHARRLAPAPFAHGLPSLASLGFEATDVASSPAGAGMDAAHRLADAFEEKIAAYGTERDRPAVDGTSSLSVHNRFGTISIRELARRALAYDNDGARTWLSELAWRDFFFQVLWHHPRAARESFRAEYANLEWPDDRVLFDAWREGRTGYPLVDAGMRQLATTGTMHNRVRMVVASFLCKDLLVDWRLGERHFADLLLDYDLAANNGNWQWAASTGCDAQPYFRIFNPVSQSERFDPQGAYVRRHVPELGRVPDRYIHAPWTMPADVQRASGCVIGRAYPGPIVEHAAQREKALALYRRAATPA